MRFLHGDIFGLFLGVFFREGRTPDGTLIFFVLLAFTLLRALDREVNGAVVKKSSSSARKTLMFVQPCTAVGDCPEVGSSLFVWSALAGVLLPGWFMVVPCKRANSPGVSL
jgi:hypothetical protein